ncbi:MAG TPA: MFS transporter [Thermoanaerobaculia bacterium]|nr:MFS transporter [Thermoanaerobaculia bacterium]
MNGYRWFRAGDLNAFFALMFDNVANLVILTAILVGAFHFPREIVLYRMVPGTAVGVLVGDLIYAAMARRLARRTGRDDVTAMPLGLNAPSVFGMSFAVLGPAYLVTGDAMLCWKMGMAVTVLVGLFKLGLALAGNAVRAAVPRAALLGSIGGAGLALIGLLPLLKVFSHPIVGFVALGVILVTLLGRVRLPWGLPGVFVSVILAVAVFYALQGFGIASPLASTSASALEEVRVSFPWPSLAFLGGLSLALGHLPIALPFALATVVGGVDNTESAAAAGDEYDTRAILATEGLATLAAGFCGGVVESTPYIGHPAYKKMGAGAGYAIATGLFVGLGGILGYLPFLVDWIPAAAVAPILLYIGIEVMAQAFTATPARHAPAVAFAVLPSLAFVVALEIGPLLPSGGLSALSGDTGETVRVLKLLSSGFIVTAVLWGAAAAALIDRRFRQSAAYLFVASILCLFGVIHSPTVQGTLFLPWNSGSTVPFHLAAAYTALGVLLLAASFAAPTALEEPVPERPQEESQQDSPRA